MTALIVYHKNCMDGISSAYITCEAIKDKYDIIELCPMSYGEEDINLYSKQQDVYFVDFSFKRDQLKQVIESSNHVYVLDHHKTAQAELIGLEHEYNNVTARFDMNESGATMCWKYFHNTPVPPIYQYIRDRDIWLWELPYSKEVSEYLQVNVKPNDLYSFELVAENFDYETAIDMGNILLKRQQQQVIMAAKRAREFTLNGVEFMLLNVTENISELGNFLASKHNKPALMYSITDTTVNCSIRSMDHLQDVSEVAKSFGGGGHRNAAGFEMPLLNFIELLTKETND